MEAITNLVINPKLAVDASQYNGVGSLSSYGRISISDLSGFSYAYQANTAAASDRIYYQASGAVTGGQTYRASAWVKLTSGYTLALQAADASGNNYMTTSCGISTGLWQRCSVQFTATATTIRIAARQQSNGSGILSMTGLMLTEGAVQYSYADGDSADWTWNGTSNNSTSTGPLL